MNAVEKLLKQGLDAEPEDWSVRLELAAKLAERDAGDELDQLLREAPVAPEDESQAHQAVELAHRCDRWDGVKQVLALFAAANPKSSWGKLAYAQTLLHTGDAATALVHYKQARRLDESVSDPTLGQLLSEQEVQAQAQAKASAKKEKETAGSEVAPVAVAATATGGDEDSGEATPEVRPLRPPAEAEPASGESKPAAVFVAETNEAEEAPALAVVAEDKEFDEDHGGDRSFIVGDGEMVHAHEKDSDAKAKISAITVAVLIHVLIAIALGWAVVAMPRPKPPQITANAVANLDDPTLEQKEIKKVKRAPVQSAAAQMQVTTVTAASSVSMPEINTSLTTFDPVGMGDNFGASMSFDMGEDGGMVSFFGAKSISKKVVFVVDYSASMSGAKDKLMRKELSKSIEALPNGVQYQLIMFSGPAWYAGQETTKAKKGEDGKIVHVVKDGRDEYVWYEGWDEDQRHDGSKKSALYHYSEGMDPEKLPTAEYITATRAKIRRTVKEVENTPLSFGTDWRWPLMMAMNMEPDTIYFMTDGAFGTGKGFKKEDMIKEILRYNQKKGRAKINTICMMVLNARTELEALADGSRGEFTLVLEDGTVVRGKELDKMGKKK